jgi:hypothetical protein
MGKLRGPKPKGYGKLAAPAPAAVDPNTLHVVFGFRHIVRGYDLSGGDGRAAGNFLDALRIRCSMTWAELRQQSHWGLGSEKIASAIKVRIPDSIPTDRKDELLCFRFGGDMERFIGFQSGPVFEVVWVDHDGSCYDH